ncbi:MAG: nuclear transport factor 2 family protein [Solirubrobacterales bacterium]
MSEENVDLVRRLLEMFAKREHEAVFAFYAPDIEWDATEWESIAAVNNGIVRSLSRSPSTPPPGKLADCGMMPA